MLVDQALIDQINGRMRRRLLHLPLKRGRLGELKRCPVRKGGVYRLRPPIPYAAYVERTSSSPTRARAVLSLIDLCETPVRTATITIISVERHGDVWLVHFAKGDRADELDRDVFLAKYGDYTMSASKQAVPGDPPVMMPFPEDLAKARAKARERRVSPERAEVRRVKGELETLVQAMADMKARNRVKLALRELEKSESQLLCSATSVELPSGGPDFEGDRDIRGSHSSAPLTEAELESMSEADLAQLDAEANRVVAVSLQSPA